MKKLLIGILCTILVLILGGMYVVNTQQKNKDHSIEAIYDFSSAQRMDLSEKIDTTGSVILSKNMDIYPVFEGTVRKINIKAGDSVRQGDLLLVVESPTMQSQWADANSNYRQAELNLNLAQKGLNRTKILFEAQGATIDEVETAQNKVDLYQEQLNAAKIKLMQITNMPDGSNFIDTNHYNLLIKAPFTGSIAWINAKLGDKVTNQTLLVSLADKKSLEIKADVDESEIALIHPGQRATITGSDQEQTQMEGIVSEVGAIGTEDAGIVTFPVKIKVTGRNQSIENGMSVDVTIITSFHPNVLAVPTEAVVERRGHKMVRFKQDDNVFYKRVEVGTKNSTYTEIVAGLQEGDAIAVPKPKVPKDNSRPGGNDRVRIGGFGR